MNTPSSEQIRAIESAQTSNVIVDAVAGSGKTTTILHIAKKYDTQSILLLTYNSKLKIESREKVKQFNLMNIEVHSYHAFCVKYYDKSCFTDAKIIKLFKNNIKFNKKISYDMIIVDEVQDMTPIYYQLVCKIMKELKDTPKLCILGDQYQSIFQFNNADSRFIKMADSIYRFNESPWERVSLTTSFRVTRQIASFINNCVLHEQRIKAIKDGPKVKYIICDAFGYSSASFYPFEVVKSYLKSCEPNDIFVLAPSTKVTREAINSKRFNPSPIRRLANMLTKHNIPIYISNDNEEKLDQDIMKGKVVFTTFHQVKGLERDNVIIFNFDDKYFEYYNKDGDRHVCPNQIYVALTRAKKKLALIQHHQNECFKFMDIKRIKDYAEVKSVRTPRKKSEKSNSSKIKPLATTDLVKFLPQEIINSAKSYLDITQVKPCDIVINIECKTKQGKLYENVSEITGTAIPACYEYTTKKSMSIHECLKEQNKLTNYSLLKKGNDITIPNINIYRLLKVANHYCADKSGYSYKTKQIKYYNWVTHEELQQCVNRLHSLNLSIDAIYEAPFKYEDNKILKKNKKQLVGAIDCIDKKERKVWEFKCVKELQDIHFIQLAIYAFLLETKLLNNDLSNINIHPKRGETITFKYQNEIYVGNIKELYKSGKISVIATGSNKIYKVSRQEVISITRTARRKRRMISQYKNKYEYFLYNILTDETYKIEATYANLKNMVDYVIDYKFNHANKISDEDFLRICDNIKAKYADDYVPDIENHDMKKQVMVLDIETDGRTTIIEIAYNIYDIDMNLIVSKDILINNGTDKTDYYKKITLEEIKLKGLSPLKTLDILAKDMRECKYIVCHNIRFDADHIYRYYNTFGIECSIPNKLCTMALTKRLVNAKSKTGLLKNPRLEELYEYLFKTKINTSKAHRGDYDVMITAQCLTELINRGVVTL